MKTAVIAGCTGLIGKQLLNLLLDSPDYDKVIGLTRAPLLIDHPKFQNLLPDFRAPEASLRDTRPDDVFCCLGTTMAKAVSKEKFYEVDFLYPLALAKATLGLGAAKYLLVSALGANKNSAVYYNRVKGELEDALRPLAFEAIHIFRPSLLLGPRAERRPGEEAAKVVYKVFGFLIPRKYKAIDGGKVALVMLHYAASQERGVFVHESREIGD